MMTLSIIVGLAARFVKEGDIEAGDVAIGEGGAAGAETASSVSALASGLMIGVAGVRARGGRTGGASVTAVPASATLAEPCAVVFRGRSNRSSSSAFPSLVLSR